MSSGESFDDYSSDEEPLRWNDPEPERQEVTEFQLREFEKTFATVKSQLTELTEEYEQLKAQYAKELKVSKDLQEGRKALEKERDEYDRETNLINDQLNKKPVKTKSSKKADDNAKIEMYEIQMTNRSINDLKKKKQELEKQFEEEKKHWKVERNRLLQLIRKQETENDLLKQSIEQFKSFLDDKSDHEEEAEETTIPEVVANPDAKLTKLLSPHANKQSSPRKSLDSQVTEVYLKRRSPPAPKFVVPEVNFALPNYPLNFDYWPPGEGVKIGRETKYGNGDVVIRFKNGTHKIKRGDSEHVIFPNGDIHIGYADGAVAYKYSDGAVEITLPDKTSHFLFPNGQRQVNHPNGDKHILFPDGTTQYMTASGDYQKRTPKGEIETCVNGVISKI